MTSLYYPPKFASELAGSKLSFTQTGTTTPRDTYQDEALTVPHTNPVIADANGLFAPIYLDPRGPSYRVKWTTAANVLIYQIDGYPSNQNTGGIFRLESGTPTLLFYDTDGTANQRKMGLRLSSSGLEFIKFNDAESVETLLKRVLWDADKICSKAADASRSNNTPIIDPDLQCTFDANVGALYDFEAFLVFRCASATPGTLFGFSGGGGTCRYVVNGSADAAVSFADAINFSQSAGTSGWAWTNVARHIAYVKGYISAPTNGSTFGLYWSQTITNANAMTLETGSYMRVRQVSL